MFSETMKAIVGRLQHDWNFIATFLDNPQSALGEYALSAEERQVLAERDVNGLIKLGFSKGIVLGALSGAHSKTCSRACSTSCTAGD